MGECMKRGFFIIFLIIMAGIVYGSGDTVSRGVRHWIFFKDKVGGHEVSEPTIKKGIELGISPRALKRRLKVRTEDEIIDYTDLPVNGDYIKILRDYGLKIYAVSRWLNGVSAAVPEDKIDKIRSLTFVKEVRKISGLRMNPPDIDIQKQSKHYLSRPRHSSIDYGESFAQNKQIHVPEVHELGLTGDGILIGLLDTGFDYNNAAVFQSIDVVAEHDFYWDDDVTANQSGDSEDQDHHGTSVLSVIAGFHPGYLIGPAYTASYALAKTEWVVPSGYDDTLEVDLWVEGLEWLESIGVDVVSSSLGYYQFFNGDDYTYSDLDGNTCEATIAADIAAGKGVIVVNASGNERQTSWHYVISPADGDSVISVGAVTMNGNLAPFSSGGPTADGRIKPDVVAMGSGVVCFDPYDKSYMYASGTSLSCPLVAGVCALVLQAHPELGPMEVREAIRNTASQSTSPDNLLGWGIVNCYEAVFYHGMIFSNFELVSEYNTKDIRLEMNVLSKTGVMRDSVFLFYTLDDGFSFHKVGMIYTGGKSQQHFMTERIAELDEDSFRFYLQAYDTLGNVYTAPIGAPLRLYSLFEEIPGVIPVKLKKITDFYIYQNYPNPFNQTTVIPFSVQKKSYVTLKIYNILGQQVMTIIDGVVGPGKIEAEWDGTDSMGRKVPSGIYISCLRLKNETKFRKIMLVR